MNHPVICYTIEHIFTITGTAACTEIIFNALYFFI